MKKLLREVKCLDCEPDRRMDSDKNINLEESSQTDSQVNNFEMFITYFGVRSSVCSH